MKQRVIEISEGGQKKSDGVASLVGALAAVALVIIAVAVYQISSALSIGCVAISAGIGVREACRGVGYLILARGHANAEVTKALGEGKAAVIAARTGQQPVTMYQPPSPRYLDDGKSRGG